VGKNVNKAGFGESGRPGISVDILYLGCLLKVQGRCQVNSFMIRAGVHNRSRQHLDTI
jgi:hypothetical protein